MISFRLSPSSSLFPYKSTLLSNLKPLRTLHHNTINKLNQRRINRDGRCRAEFSPEAPIAFAIGACILNSLVFPVPTSPDDHEGESLIDSADARFAVMGIVSFIPYFNWMSWVFAWMDTGKRRYAVYALVYLAPYLRSNLSISPEESWLPIASILLCIIHIQLEASIKNGDLQGFQLFSGVSRQLSQKKDIGISKEEEREHGKELPSAQDELMNAIRGWGVPKRPRQDSELVDEDGEAEKKH